jgi:hypothetical protein
MNIPAQRGGRWLTSWFGRNYVYQYSEEDNLNADPVGRWRWRNNACTYCGCFFSTVTQRMNKTCISRVRKQMLYSKNKSYAPDEYVLCWFNFLARKTFQTDLDEYHLSLHFSFLIPLYRGADKSLVRPGRKQATATEDFNVHVSYLLS